MYLCAVQISEVPPYVPFKLISKIRLQVISNEVYNWHSHTYNDGPDTMINVLHISYVPSLLL